MTGKNEKADEERERRECACDLDSCPCMGDPLLESSELEDVLPVTVTSVKRKEVRFR